MGNKIGMGFCGLMALFSFVISVYALFVAPGMALANLLFCGAFAFQAATFNNLRQIDNLRAESIKKGY